MSTLRAAWRVYFALLHNNRKRTVFNTNRINKTFMRMDRMKYCELINIR